MADHEFTAMLANEARSVLSRSVSADEFEGYVRRLCAQTADWSESDLGDAMSAWMDRVEKLDDWGRRTLPPVSSLRQMRDQNRRRPAPSSRSYLRPRPEFVEAHRRFKAELNRLGVSSGKLLTQHDHHGGAEGCPVCGPAGDARRALVEELLEGLPAPVDGPVMRCRCDGGWVPDSGGRVRPCSRCLPEAYEQLLAGEFR